MVSDTLKKELDQYGIGQRLRSLRLRKKLGLVDLGRHTGLSPALLSKLETGRLYPTLPTLQRIALVFGVGLEHFFLRQDGVEPAIVHRREERLKFPDRADAGEPSYVFESLDFKALDRPISSYYVEFHPVAVDEAREHAHPGVELIYVIHGTLGLRIAGADLLIGAGDAVYLDATRRHSYRRLGKPRCTAIVVTSPAGSMGTASPSPAPAPGARPAAPGAGPPRRGA
jgi:transcriptional regulator with XRE-family HTH domain